MAAGEAGIEGGVTAGEVPARGCTPQHCTGGRFRHASLAAIAGCVGITPGGAEARRGGPRVGALESRLRAPTHTTRGPRCQLHRPSPCQDAANNEGLLQADQQTAHTGRAGLCSRGWVAGLGGEGTGLPRRPTWLQREQRHPPAGCSHPLPSPAM